MPQPNGVKSPQGLKPVGCPYVRDMEPFITVKVRRVMDFLKDDSHSAPWIEATFLYICRVVLRDGACTQPEQQSAEMVIVEYADKRQGHYFPCFGEVWFYKSEEEPKQTWGPNFDVQNLLGDYVRSMIVFIPTIAKVAKSIDIVWLAGFKTTPRPDSATPGFIHWTVTPLWHLGGVENEYAPKKLPQIQFYATWGQFKNIYVPGKTFCTLNMRGFSSDPPFPPSTLCSQIKEVLENNSSIGAALGVLNLGTDCRYRLPWFFRQKTGAVTRTLQTKFLEWLASDDAGSSTPTRPSPWQSYPPEERCTGSNVSQAPLADNGQHFQSPGMAYGGVQANYVEDIQTHSGSAAFGDTDLACLPRV